MHPSEIRTPEVVTICGSMTVFGDMLDVAAAESLRGVLVHLPVPVPDAADHTNTLDLLHRHKIDLSDRVIVVTRSHRIGHSTRGEITYAEEHGKIVEYRNFGDT